MSKSKEKRNTVQEVPDTQRIIVKQEILDEPEPYHFVKAKEAAFGYGEHFLNIVNIKQEDQDVEGDVIPRDTEEPLFMGMAWDVMKTFNLTSEGEFHWMPYKVLSAHTQELTERHIKYYLDLMIGESKTKKTEMTAHVFGKQMKGDLQLNTPLITYRVEILNFMGDVVKMEEIYQYQNCIDFENASLRKRKFDWVLTEPRNRLSRVEDVERIRALVSHSTEAGSAKRNQERHMSVISNIMNDFNARSKGQYRWIPLKVLSARARKLHAHTNYFMEVFVGESTSLKTDPPKTRSFPPLKLKENAKRILYKMWFTDFNNKYELRNVEIVREVDPYDKL